MNLTLERARSPTYPHLSPRAQDVLRVTAITAMVLDHVNRVFLASDIAIFTLAGRLAFPLFALLIAHNIQARGVPWQRYVAPLLEMRKHKNLSEHDALEALEDNVMLGTMMLALGEVDGLVSGAVHSSANTIRPALQLIKTHPQARVVSSVFFMCLPDQVLVYGDCAVNPNPDAEALADIAIQSAETAEQFGIPARVALISYSTGESGSGEDVERVRQATAIAEVAATKAPFSLVAGKATVFVFPDLNTGNTTYKAVQRSANLVSIGPVLQGLRKPVNDLSRGALVDDIIYTIAVTAIQSARDYQQE